MPARSRGSAPEPRCAVTNHPTSPAPTMFRNAPVLLGLAALLSATEALAQATLTPLPGFGVNGWIAPAGAYPFLGIANAERGLVYNPTTGNLLLVSRSGGNFVRVLSGATGVDTGVPFDLTGVAGGQFAVNMIDVDETGAIYLGNLSISTAQPFTVYTWPAEAVATAAPPTIAYTSTGLLSRIGDSFAVHGGLSTPAKFAAAGSTISQNSTFLVGTLDATNAGTAFTSVPGTNTGSSNDYRLGMTFVDADTLIGNQGGTGGSARMTTFDTTLATATVDASIPMGAAGRRALDYAVILGRPVLAVVDTNTSQVTVFDITNPATPVVLAQANNTTGTLTANGNGVGSVSWGPVLGNTAVLYAMSTNQGIQAFQFTLAPPASFTTFGTGCDGLGIAAPTLPTVGNLAFTIDVTNVPGISPIGFVAFGTAAIPGGIDLTAQNMPGCFSYTTLDVGIFGGGPVVAGVSQLALPLGNTPSLAGASLAVQGASLSSNIPAGYAASNGAFLVVGF
jgi:hypothetical protein